MGEKKKDIELRKSIDVLAEEFEDFKRQNGNLVEYIAKFQEGLKKENKNLKKPFEMLYLPSEGFFYQNKNTYLLIGYLTYIEENLLTSEMLVESGIAYDIAFGNLIYNEDITIQELLTGDVQAMSLALRSYSYGNNIELELNCAHCNRPSKVNVPLTAFKMKDTKVKPDEDGDINVIIGKDFLNFKIRPITFKQEVEFGKKENKLPLEDMAIYVKSINDETDKKKILNTIRSLRLLESRELRRAIQENIPGVDTKYEYECEYCEEKTNYDFGGNAVDLLKLPYSYRNNVLEEIFLLVYYGKSITIEDAKRMPVTERRWFINRISEEVEKQREYEKKEMAKSKSKSR